MFAYLSDPTIWLSFATLAMLEIILGIDNIIFVSIIAEKLPPERRAGARFIGLGLALLMRVALLFSLTRLVTMTAPVLHLTGKSFSWRDIILFGGGLFLIAKATIEINEAIEGHERSGPARVVSSFAGVIVQIILIDVVFSVDSILTAIGLTDELPVMIAAVVVAIIVMMVAAGPVAAFVEKHLSIKMLALAFLVLIGMVLIADGLGFHIPKGYVYASVGFSLAVQALVLLAQRRRGEA